MFQAIVFDFDLTLADSRTAIVQCLRYGLEHLGLPPLSDERIVTAIGLSLPATLTYLTGIDDPSITTVFENQVLERSGEITVGLTTIFETVPPLLASLRSSGLALGIASTKYRCRLEAILRRDDLLHHFDVIVGGDDVDRHKPDPAGLLQALDRLGGAPEHLVYVGDHPVDAEAAQRAGIAFVAVLTGHSTSEDFAVYPSRDIIADLSALIRVVPLAGRRQHRWRGR